MTPFFRFPSTPHLSWLGPGSPREDKVLDAADVKALLGHELRVEEKVDGANLGLWIDDGGSLRAQNRGSILQPGGHPQWGPLWPWLDARRELLSERLSPGLIVFGEWCFARHSVHYTALPDWFLAFDVWDRAAERFWSAQRRDALLASLGLEAVPHWGTARFGLSALVTLVEERPSSLGAAAPEGLVVRHDDAQWLCDKAKLVRGEFVAAIEAHWSRRRLEPNRLAS
jgi:ATP-dependent RNA circularization protein (DNA/RNA ligase family)